MAKQTESRITEMTADRFERITLAMANGEEVSAEDQAWIEDFNAKQEIIQSALKEGRRIEQEPLTLDDGRAVVQWKEFLPMQDGEVLIRMGTDVIDEGIFGIEVTRTANYYNPNDPTTIGTIQSVIAGGEEEITDIDDYSGLGVFGDLKIGDVRPAPLLSSSAAGQRPQTIDPSPDGSLGIASGGSNQTPTDTTSSESTTSGRMGTGLLDPTDGPDSTESHYEGASDPGVESSTDSSSSDAPGADASSNEGGRTETFNVTHRDSAGNESTYQKSVTHNSDGSVTVKTSGHEGAPEGTSITYESEDAYKQAEAQQDAGTVSSEGSGTTVEVEKPEQSTDERRDPELEHSTSGAPLPQHEAPIDYGDAADPNYDPVIPNKDQILSIHGDNPLILVDPSSYEASTTGQITEPDVVNELQNYGNPLDENQVIAPGGGIPNTSEQEYIGGDAFAATSADMIESAGEESPNQESPEEMGGDDPLP